MKKVNEKQVNSIVRALRSNNWGVKEFETIAKKNGKSFNEETVSAIILGLRDAQRANLSSKVCWR